MSGSGKTGGGEEMAGREVAAVKEKTCFAVTCNLLSQYIKERKGGLEGSGLDMAPPAAVGGEEMAGRAVAAAKEKTCFNVTCNLLRQYLKERQGGLEGSGLDMAPPAAVGGVAGVFRPPTTINLLSGLDAPAEEPNAAKTVCEPRTSDPVELSLEKASTDPPLKAPTDKQNDENTREAAGEEAQQLTIFYGGKVAVFDNFPSTKFEDLLQMVNTGDGVDKASSSAEPAPTCTEQSF